jgi:hypothetical protein
VCLVLREPCATLSQLCGGENCLYALFNNRVTTQPKCCPVRELRDPLLDMFPDPPSDPSQDAAPPNAQG